MALRNIARTAAVTMVLAALLLSAPAAGAQEDDSLYVRGVLFFSPTCGHCEYVINDVLPGVFEQFGGEPEVFFDDTLPPQDVAFYAIDAAGLDVGDMGSAEYAHAQEGMTASISRSNLTDSLRLLADETGGIAIINTNDVAPKLELVRQDMFTYYSIGRSVMGPDS